MAYRTPFESRLEKSEGDAGEVEPAARAVVIPTAIPESAGALAW